MDQYDQPRPARSPCAVPYDHFAADSKVDRELLVTEQAHAPAVDLSSGTDAAGGDGD
ncbi:MAG TPA: hypothetical protein VFV76_01090 [Actinomycetes bacterium]|nr:hypothetical protein [Actinomycetes bacterium]